MILFIKQVLIKLMITIATTSDKYIRTKIYIFFPCSLNLTGAFLTLALIFYGSVFFVHNAQAANSPIQRQDDNLNSDQSYPEEVTDVTDVKSATIAISGSPWPGVLDHLLERLPDQTTNQMSKPAIHINYPSLGNKTVDRDIREWVDSVASAFEEYLVIPELVQEEQNFEIGRFLLDDDLNLPAQIEKNFELWGNYQISRPSKNAVTIIFELWNYTGSEQGNLDILTLNYNLLSGQRLSFVDIFTHPDIALELMSSWTRKKLKDRFGGNMSNKNLEDGTMPLIENFSSLTLTPGGICINFQPWQVAEWAIGIQKVEMPLEALKDAEPLLALWDK